MALNVTHYLIVDTPASGVQEFALGAPGAPLWCFEALSQLRPVRRINWEQTFARRGLAYSDYSAWDERTDENRFVFCPRGNKIRRKSSAKVFERAGKNDDTLQGDLLTYVCSERRLLGAAMRATSMEAPQPFETELRARRMLVGTEWIDRFKEFEQTKSARDLHRYLLGNWTPQSFAHAWS